MYRGIGRERRSITRSGPRQQPKFSRPYSAVTLAALMIGHHLATSAFW